MFFGVEYSAYNFVEPGRKEILARLTLKMPESRTKTSNDEADFINEGIMLQQLMYVLTRLA